MKSTATLLGLIGLAYPMDIKNNNKPVQRRHLNNFKQIVNQCKVLLGQVEVSKCNVDQKKFF